MSSDNPPEKITVVLESPGAAASPISPTALPKKVSKPPEGYKFVKVRKEDGSIVTVKRKLSPEELAAAGVNSGDDKTLKKTFKNSPKESSKGPPKGDTIGSASTSPSPMALSVSGPSPSKPPTYIATEDQPRQQSSNEPASQETLEEQTARFREKRRSRFKKSLIRGLAPLVGSTLPGFEIDEFHQGDEIVEHDDDPSEDDLDDNEDETEGVGSNGSSGADARNDDHDLTNGHHVHVGTGAAATAAANTITTTAHQSTPTPNQANKNPNIPAGKGEKEKGTYINVKEVDKLETALTERELPLKRHWANFSFYLMASLSIVLPLLFLLLALFIVLMNKRSVTSSWHKMEQVIKVAISVWPIVFAAVVAQAFKSYATYKVERGIKLMELEQLIGSHSFASAMKQPFLLRRLDIFTLVLFLVWCLSPLGTQGLQRSYGKTPQITHDYTVEVPYLNMTGYNRLFSHNVSNAVKDDDYYSDLQLASVYYMSAFLPLSESDQVKNTMYQDRYDNPGISLPVVPGKYSDTPLASAYGVPIVLPPVPFDIGSDSETQLIDDQRYDEISFDITASYFQLTCGDWSLTPFGDIKDNLSFPQNSEYGIGTIDEANLGEDPNTYLPNYRPNFVAFASHNRPVVSNNTTDGAFLLPEDNWEYSYIECTYDQVFIDLHVSCFRMASTNMLPVCQTSIFNQPSTQKSQGPQDATLDDFSEEWVDGTSPISASFVTSMTEKYIYNGTLLDDPSNVPATTFFNLSSMTSTEDFEWYFGYNFNTWVNLGYCTECIDVISIRDIPPKSKHLYIYTEARHSITGDYIYRVYAGWMVLYFSCTGLLLIAGTFSVILEYKTVAPDVLGYVSTVARNSRYLHLPKTSSAMSGGERARKLGGFEVMMQDVKGNADVGRIALGMKHEGAQKLRPDRIYR